MAVVVVVVGGGHFRHDAVSAPQSSLAPHCGRQACSGAGAWLRRVRLGRLCAMAMAAVNISKTQTQMATAPGRAASSAAGGPAESPPGSEASAAAAPASTAAMAPGEEPTWDDDAEDIWRAPWDDQSMSWGAAEPPATAALAPAAERWAWSESDGWRRDTRPVVLAGRAASSAAGAPASGPAWGDDVGDYWLSTWIDVNSDWAGPRLPLRAAPSAAENATGAKSAGKGSPKSQQKGKQQKADHYAGKSGVFPSKGGAYWPTGRGWIWRPYPL